MDGAIEILKLISSNGGWGVAALSIWALYKLFKINEKIQAERIQDAKASQEDARRVITLAAEMQLLIQDLKISKRIG